MLREALPDSVARAGSDHHEFHLGEIYQLPIVQVDGELEREEVTE